MDKVTLLSNVINDSKKYEGSRNSLYAYYVLSDNIGIQILITAKYPEILKYKNHQLSPYEVTTFNKKFSTNYANIKLDIEEAPGDQIFGEDYYILTFSLV